LNKQLKHFSIGLTLPLLVLLTTSTGFAAPNTKIDNNTCGIVGGQLTGGVNSLGPWDYTQPATHVHLERVEGSYFPPQVENLSGNPEQGAGYAGKTLRIYPNHHRALYTMMRYYRDYPVRGNNNTDVYTMECLFTRASFFAPKDPMVYMLNGMYYHWNSDFVGSKIKYMQAYKLEPENPQVNYNLGLMYFDQGDYENAAKHADIAYSGGYPLQGLRKKLSRVEEAAPAKVDAALMESTEEAAVDNADPAPADAMQEAAAAQAVETP
jgi:hypothetical protein